MATCETCRWWVAMRCKRHPPGLIASIYGVWPRTEPDDWCGEHQPKGNSDG